MDVQLMLKPQMFDLEYPCKRGCSYAPWIIEIMSLVTGRVKDHPFIKGWLNHLKDVTSHALSEDAALSACNRGTVSEKVVVGTGYFYGSSNYRYTSFPHPVMIVGHRRYLDGGLLVFVGVFR